MKSPFLTFKHLVVYIETFSGTLIHRMPSCLDLSAPPASIHQKQGTILLTSSDVKEFLTLLAVKRKDSASSQNQAVNALLFFFRHILKKEFGEIKDVPWAKRRTYIPVVLSRKEVDTVIDLHPNHQKHDYQGEEKSAGFLNIV